jgi:phosphatidylethanolamine-binding protein (PEBP) family uncharacterized protein
MTRLLRAPREQQASANPPNPSSPASKEGGGATPTPQNPQGSQVPASQGKSTKKGPRPVLPAGEPEPGATPAERAEATIANISLSSPALGSAAEGAGALPAKYTCDGNDTWPELTWTGIPAGTQELALFAMNSQPVDEKLFFDWAVAGIDPSLEGIQEGKLPKGAVVGRNDFGKVGYSICPPGGKAETYIFALYALPQPLNATKGFDPFALRNEILEVSGNVGLLAVSY